MSFSNFSSWPHDQEQSFVVFERRASESSSKALVASIVTSAVVLVLALGIYFGVEPDKRDITKDMNMSNLGKKKPGAESKAAPAETPDKPAAEAPDKK
jgi:hypothetical protein